MGLRDFPFEFRRRVLGLFNRGLRAASIAHDLEIGDQTIYVWRRQDGIDSGEITGLISAERSELRAVKKGIAE